LAACSRIGPGMDCGVQVDAGKPTIIAEYLMKTLRFLASKRASDNTKS
jgi:hypothetical protein